MSAFRPAISTDPPQQVFATSWDRTSQGAKGVLKRLDDTNLYEPELGTLHHHGVLFRFICLRRPTAKQLESAAGRTALQGVWCLKLRSELDIRIELIF